MKNKGYKDRFIHVSVPIVPKSTTHGIVFVAGWPHKTYNIGHNKFKRESRRALRQLREKINERRVRTAD